MKRFISVFFTISLLLVNAEAIAASALIDLPLGVELGKTTNAELEQNGVCNKQVKIKQTNAFNCEKFEFLGGAVEIDCSSNQIAESMWIEMIPENWSSLGLRMYRDKEEGMTLKDLLKILEAENVEDLAVKETYKHTHAGQLAMHNHLITFNIGNYHYGVLHEYKTIEKAQENASAAPEILYINEGIGAISVVTAY
ncbi:hypothetical protein RJ45_04215 [Photobacterium gaetbulicola]|uniref:Uncharacterized protein n=1 Tax=Photobacterium gaetbulicola TaxID=1295392 RepID=A0A0B9H1P2_9GAMM|nr:hypothetical protein [Photobacterium gaetbulicola]KHT64851.1 hypothetical protein RJ45_04215 [Photobacterium gaetbulicola]